MRISGYLVPFPDPGAADLMSGHLEQEVRATGPGRIVIRVSLPAVRSSNGPESAVYAPKKLGLYRREGGQWRLVEEAASESRQEWDEISWKVASAGTLKVRLTNMSGTEGQFSLECAFIPSPENTH